MKDGNVHQIDFSWSVILTHVLDCFYRACGFWFENRFLKSHIYYTYNDVLENSQCNFFCISKCCNNQKEFHYKKEKMIIAKWYLHKIRLLIILIDVFCIHYRPTLGCWIKISSFQFQKYPCLGINVFHFHYLSKLTFCARRWNCS